MFELTFIRHADPDYENDTITARGHIQAKALADYLSPIRIDSIFSSPFGRAQATMRYVAEKKNMNGTVLPWLGELDGCYARTETGAGLWAWNHHAVDVCAKGPVTLENWKTNVPYAEKMTAVCAAQHAAFDDFLASFGILREGLRYRITTALTDTHIAFFCHEGFIKTLLPHLVQIPLPVAYGQTTIFPSSRSIFVLDEKSGYAAFRMRTLNDCSHYADCEQRK